MLDQLASDSPAKINLWLRIHGKREDGFHEVETRLVKIKIADHIELRLLKEAEPGMTLTCNVPDIPTDERNLVIKALMAFEAKLGKNYRWDVRLEKRVPHGAGLGGGSSNAATVLKLANELLQKPLNESELIGIAATLGSDVPFFLLPGAAADGAGKGDLVKAAYFEKELPVVLIKPPFPIPTPWAYQRWVGSKELPGVLYAPQLCEWGSMVNHLERPVFEKHRLLPALKMWLRSHGFVQASLMSGSGSTVFAVTQTQAQAVKLAEAAREYCGPEAWVQATSTWSDKIH